MGTLRKPVREPDDDPGDVAWPVALKVLSPDLAHKTELGGVRLGVPDAAALEVALRLKAFGRSGQSEDHVAPVLIGDGRGERW